MILSKISESLTEHEWLRRYTQRFIDRVGLSATEAQKCAAAEPFDVLSELFEDDPEGAADEELSYWSGD